jgi:hypothetical protein
LSAATCAKKTRNEGRVHRALGNSTSSWGAARSPDPTRRARVSAGGRPGSRDTADRAAARESAQAKLKAHSGGEAPAAAKAKDRPDLKKGGDHAKSASAPKPGGGGGGVAYRAMDPDGDGLPSFAPHVLSGPGLRDGLDWPDAFDAPESPVGDFMARATADAEPEPYLGHYFRALGRPGDKA